MSFAVLKTLVPASSISAVASGHVTGADELNMIVGRGNVLQVYRVLDAATSSPSSSSSTANDAAPATLTLMLEQTLFGRIASIVVFRPAGWPRDLIGVSCHAAKLVLLQFDVTRSELSVVSMHYFES
jgi:hypothetical protein